MFLHLGRSFLRLRMLSKYFYVSKGFVLFYALWICFVIVSSDSSVWRETTACYGADNKCSQYSLECTPGTKIVLGALMYGSKNGDQKCQFGISDCSVTDNIKTCCSYNTSDTFTPFILENFTAVQENCEGQTACAGWAPRRKTAPYSSYIWIQYTCVSERNITDMCKTNKLVGNHLFVRFNTSNSRSSNSMISPTECSCRFSTPDCSATLITTLVDIDFRLPYLDDLVPTSDALSPACSSASLSLTNNSDSYSCTNTQWYTGENQVQRMTEIEVSSAAMIVTLNNINISSTSGPNYVVMYVRASPQTPLLLDCFESGKKPVLTNHCQTKTTHSTSPNSLTPSSVGSSTTTSTVFETITYNTTESSPTKNSPVTLSLSTGSSGTPLKTPPSPTLEEYSSTSGSKITFSKIPDHQSESSSIHVSTGNPSIDVSRDLTHKSQTGLVSSTLSTRTDSITSIIDNQSTMETFSRSPIIVTSKPTVGRSSTGATSSPVRPVSETSPIISVTSEPISKLTKINPETSRDNKENVSTTIGVQSENTNIEETTRDGGIKTTQGTGVTIDDSGSNNGLIIGVTVAVVIAALVIVGVVMVCLCIRIKRKEKIRRNYVRNTNIFFSLPQDYTDAGSTQSDFSPEDDRLEPSFTNIPRSKLYESVGNPSPSSTLSKANTPSYFDQYKIKPTIEGSADNVETITDAVMPSDSNYTGETSTETIAFVNDIEEGNPDKTGIANGGRTVSFDPSTLYAQVRKEGKTKF